VAGRVDLARHQWSPRGPGCTPGRRKVKHTERC
jgi:hypothetical protein